MIKVLVTGAEGQLGKCIQKIAKNYPQLEFVFHNSNALDITNRTQVKEVFSKENFEYCFNCAAYTNVEQAEKTPEPAYAVNAEGVKNIAKACAEYNTILLHISTDYVFDGQKKTPYRVLDETNPINEYGKSKLKGEEYIQDYLEKYFIIRTSWLYSEFGKNFYKIIIEKAKTESVLKITDQQTGCPTNANNLAKYMIDISIAKRNVYGLHHFTDGEAMTWFDFAKRILDENGLDVKIEPENYLTIAKRPKYTVLA